MKYSRLLVLVLVFITSVFAVTPEGTVIENYGITSWRDASGTINYPGYTDTTLVILTFNGSLEIVPDTLFNTEYLENTTTYAHQIINHGNGTDTLRLYSVNDQGWATEIYKDINENGTYDVGTDSLMSPFQDYVLAMNDSLPIVVNVTLDDDESFFGDTAVTEIIVTSQRDISVVDSGYDLTQVIGPELNLDLAADPEAPDFISGADTITYTLEVAANNFAYNEAAYEITLSAPRPNNSVFVDNDSIPFGTGWSTRYFDGSWSTTFSSTADSIQFRLRRASLESILPGDTLYFQWNVKADSCLDTSITEFVIANYEDVTSIPHLYVDSSNIVSTDPHDALIVPDTLVILQSGSITDTLFFSFDLENISGSDSDRVFFTLDSLFDNVYWNPYELYIDANANGILEAAERLAGTVDTSLNIPSGDVDAFIVRVIIPTTTDYVDSTWVKYYSLNNTCRRDSILLIGNITFPLMLAEMNILEDTDDDDILETIPSDTISYVIKFWNIGTGVADSFIVVDTLDTNTYLQGGGALTDYITQLPAAGFVVGDFDVEYSTDGGTVFNDITLAPTGDIVHIGTTPVIIRFRETSTNTIPTTSSPLPIADPQNDPAQGEFRFKVRIR